MKWINLSVLMVLPAAVLALHPLGCDAFYTCEDDGTCVEVPEGWTGYHFLREVDDAKAEAEPCGDGAKPMPYYMNPPPDDSQKCRNCACDPKDLAKGCSLPKLECWDGSSCDAGTKLKTNVNVDKCVTSYWNEDSNGTAFQESEKARCKISGNAEPPFVGAIESKTIDWPRWGARLDICDVPSPETMDLICIQGSGHGRACPTGWEHSLEAYTTGVDSRTCSPCACETRCEWNGYVLSDYCHYENSGGNTIMINDPGNCVGIKYEEMDYGIKTKKPQLIPEATGGELLGTLEPQGPVTFCCKQAEQ